MPHQLIECVPNFSEGRSISLIKQITDQIESVDGVSLLDVDPASATNRTVVTFVGRPEAVIEAVIRSASKAAELIDMSKHHGKHPRFGAMDVCPLIPFANITMEETVSHAHRLAKRLGEEVGLTIYCYENAATKSERRDLFFVRKGEYEGLVKQLIKPEMKPDYGPVEFNVKSGATAVGARDFLIAYNINLNTTFSRYANMIASELREKGHKKRLGDPFTGTIVKNRKKNKEIWIPGKLKSVKGIGWYLEDYRISQVSLNLTNHNVTPLHVAFEESFKCATKHGVSVTGSEIVGLVPLAAILNSGHYFLKQSRDSKGTSHAELIRIAVNSLGLNDLYDFDPRKKIIEYAFIDRKEELK